MPHTVTMPPDAQLEPLLRGYRRAVAAKRRRLVLGVAILAAACSPPAPAPRWTAAVLG